MTVSEKCALSKEEKKCQAEERFKELFREHFVSLSIFAGNYLADEEAAKDAVNDVFCKLWESPSDFTAITNVKSYLYSVVRNRCLDILRRKNVHNRYVHRSFLEMKESDTYFEMETLREEVYCLLDKAIRKLPERSAEILLLKMKGLKNQEIAEKLNISINTVNTLKTNSYKILKELLKDKYFICWLLFLRKF